VGQSKADLIGTRIKAINPRAEVRVCNEFYNKETSASLLTPRPDVVIDCIDNVTAKMHLVATCVAENIPVVSTLGAGARLDPTCIRVLPLTESHTDPLGRALRKHIRRKHNVTEKQLAKVIAVFSDEEVRRPITDHGGVVCGLDCVCPNADNKHHTCKRRHIIYGTAVFVTSAFGMAAASAAVRTLLGMNPLSPVPEFSVLSGKVKKS
jgi:tRNA threonylcarbamoyladenosine dehydratase